MTYAHPHPVSYENQEEQSFNPITQADIRELEEEERSDAYYADKQEDAMWKVDYEEEWRREYYANRGLNFNRI